MSQQPNVTEPSRVTAERISCLIDGELERGDAEALLDSVCSDPDLRKQWTQLHLVGDALRSSEVAAGHAESFCTRVAAALAHEPTVLAPRPRAAKPYSRRWLVPGVAVAASVAALGFIALPMVNQTQAPVTSLAVAPAVAPAPVVAEPVQQVAARRVAPGGAVLDVYLSAHRELTGGTAMPRAAHYLRVNDGEDR